MQPINGGASVAGAMTLGFFLYLPVSFFLGVDPVFGSPRNLSDLYVACAVFSGLFFRGTRELVLIGGVIFGIFYVWAMATGQV